MSVPAGMARLQYTAFRAFSVFSRALTLIAGGLIVGILVAGSPAAFAQRGELYVVSGVQVDAAAANSRDARTLAIDAGQIEAARRMVARLTLAAERASRGAVAVDLAAARRMIIGLEVEQERQSATRYLASLKFSFDPGEVRNYLRARNLQFAEYRGAPILVVPIVEPDSASYADFWRRSWLVGGFRNELRPLEVAAKGSVLREDWSAASPAAGAVLADSAIFARLTVAIGPVAGAGAAGARVVAKARQVSASGDTDLGTVTLTGPASDVAGVQALLDRAARMIVEQATEEWKRQAFGRAGSGTGLAVTALYSSQSEWIRLRAALERSRLLTGIRQQAISYDGALLRLSFAGAEDLLKADLGKQGILLESGDIGPTLRLKAP